MEKNESLERLSISEIREELAFLQDKKTAALRQMQQVDHEKYPDPSWIFERIKILKAEIAQREKDNEA